MSPTVNLSQPAESLAKALQEVALSEPFKSLMAVVDHNTTLKAENDALHIANLQNFKTVTQIQQQLDDRSNLIVQKDAMLNRANSEKKTLSHSLEMAKRTSAEKSTESEKIKKEMSQLRSSFDRVQQHLFKMQPIDKSTVCKQLDDVRRSIYAVIEKYFGGDLEEGVLAENNCWDRIRDHPVVKDIIPLPQSNSTAAKQMRVAAMLAICADALWRRVFQSTYLLLNSNELSNFMSDLSVEEPSKEWFLRSVFLKINPKKQRENGKIWADEAVKDVTNCVSLILPKEKLRDFQSSLSITYGKACDMWFRLQEVDGKIVSIMDYSDEQGWRPLPFPLPKDETGKQKQMGTPQRKDSDVKELSRTPKSSNLDEEDIGIVVWPAFLFHKHGNEEVELLKGGFVVTEEQMQQARYEEPATRLGKRRMSRLKARSLSMTSKNGEANRGKSFLSSGDGAGSKGS